MDDGSTGRQLIAAVASEVSAGAAKVEMGSVTAYVILIILLILDLTGIFSVTTFFL